MCRTRFISAYIFADAGYDVWLPNARGNFYSRKHKTKDPDLSSSGFWDFAWYEIGIYDLPAVIDYVLQETLSPKVYCIGHSQGTTELIALLAVKQEYNDKIYAASLLGPAGYTRVHPILYAVASVMKVRKCQYSNQSIG